MRTHDTRLVGEVETYATDYNMVDFKIVYRCGKGNNTNKVVFMPVLKTNRDTFIESGAIYTTVQEAVISLLNDMMKAQKNLDRFYAEQLDNYEAE
jgi:hypothetical protein